MNHSISKFRLVIMIATMLSFSAVANAQRGYHFNNHNNYHNNYNGHYSYNYQSNYRYSPVRMTTPYYRPNYYYRPVYRPNYYRPTYRLPHFIHYGPRFGFHLSILPFGYSTIYVGRSPYYYNDGIYYRPYTNGGYEVTAAPIGAEISRLPSGAKATVIDGTKYYELGGTFYQEEISSDNRRIYRVVGTDGVLNTGNADQDGPIANNDPNVNNEPNVNSNNVDPVPNNVSPVPSYVAPVVGSRVDQLPGGSKVVVINQQKYYLSADGVYYQEVIEGNSVRYEVTGTPAN